MREQVINLGKALVEELEIEPGVDTLSRWLVYYIAEQIKISEALSGIKKKEAEKICFETILKLWEHRAYYLPDRRPFINFEPVFRALERLDPENEKPYYYNDSDLYLTKEKRDEESEETKRWLDIALAIDKAVRVWLVYIFKEAAKSAVDVKTTKWLKNSINLMHQNDASVIIKLMGEIEKGKTEDEQEKRSREINSRINTLKAFKKFSLDLQKIFEDELELLKRNISQKK